MEIIEKVYIWKEDKQTNIGYGNPYIQCLAKLWLLTRHQNWTRRFGSVIVADYNGFWGEVGGTTGTLMIWFKEQMGERV